MRIWKGVEMRGRESSMENVPSEYFLVTKLHGMLYRLAFDGAVYLESTEIPFKAETS